MLFKIEYDIDVSMSCVFQLRKSAMFCHKSPIGRGNRFFCCYPCLHAYIAHPTLRSSQLFLGVLLSRKQELFFGQVTLAVITKTRPHTWLDVRTRTHLAKNVCSFVWQLPHVLCEGHATLLLQTFHTPPFETILAKAFAVAKHPLRFGECFSALTFPALSASPRQAIFASTQLIALAPLV